MTTDVGSGLYSFPSFSSHSCTIVHFVLYTPIYGMQLCASFYMIPNFSMPVFDSYLTFMSYCRLKAAVPKLKTALAQPFELSTYTVKIIFLEMHIFHEYFILKWKHEGISQAVLLLLHINGSAFQTDAKRTHVLYISTSVWVLRTPNAGRNSHFQHFFMQKRKKITANFCKKQFF